MFKIITNKKYKALLKEIKELKEPKDMITISAAEHIDNSWLFENKKTIRDFGISLENARIKRNLPIALIKQIVKDELITYYKSSDKPDMVYAQIRIIKPKYTKSYV